ncbi:hypothetical protein EDC04DRAFT_2687257 [Pisolithus marmoratus]|nr:hypothetical protein EDC04DRAFT_2687257 [Pisolithus marmoratus]
MLTARKASACIALHFSLEVDLGCAIVCVERQKKEGFVRATISVYVIYRRPRSGYLRLMETTAMRSLRVKRTWQRLALARLIAN